MNTQAPIKPTIKEMLAVWRKDYEEGAWERVERPASENYRIGSSTNGFIAHRLSDNTYWCVNYFRKADLDDSSVLQVVPVEVKKIEWREVAR